MTPEEKKALRERLAARTKAEMDALWSDPAFRAEHAIWEKEYQARVAMHKAREKSGLTQLDLAERMNTNRSNISRIEDGRNVTIATFARYLYECGFDFRITVFPLLEAKPSGAFRMTRAPRGRRQPAFA